MSLSQSTAYQVGKFLLTPFSRITHHGTFTASLSVKRGQGQASHDRIYTFRPEFSTSQAALDHAKTQGKHWELHPQAFA